MLGWIGGLIPLDMKLLLCYFFGESLMLRRSLDFGNPTLLVPKLRLGNGYLCSVFPLEKVISFAKSGVLV